MKSTLTPSKIFLGIDAGGTFTDFVMVQNGEWKIHKVLSTPEDPSKAILTGIKELNLSGKLDSGEVAIVHGSTVATNAALENKVARTLYITNKGFKDLLTLGRQARPELYNLFPSPPREPVPRELCLEIDCRRDSKGQLIKPLEESDLNQLFEQVQAIEPEAIAINLLFSFLNDAEEREIEDKLNSIAPVSRSSEILPVYKEYERGIATWLNASLGPKVQQYLLRLREKIPDQTTVSIMQSNGGTMSLELASQRAVNLLLSGPAGGLSAVSQIANECKLPKIISFDMGGTSTDVALMDERFEITLEAKINEWPVAIPMLEIETIGAGGGSIAWLDTAGMLHVGPQSAGSDPGPACYGNGGESVTVTDANLFLGRLRPDEFLGGRMRLDLDASVLAIRKLAKQAGITANEMALGIVQIAEQQMVQALHAISVKKGHDPSEFALCCFGGAGGLHVCALAEKMGMHNAIVPNNGGVFSALGMLCAPRKRFLNQTFSKKWSDISLSDLESALNKLSSSARLELQSEASIDSKIIELFSIDLRYQGQSYFLNVPLGSQADQDFVKAHETLYGHRLNYDIEVVNICAELYVDNDMRLQILNDEKQNKAPYKMAKVFGYEEDVPIIPRETLAPGTQLKGPAIVTEHVSTTWIKEGWLATIDAYGNLRLSRVN